MERLKMKKLRMTIFAVGALAIGGMSAMGPAQAAVQGGADAIRQAAENGAITEQAQFFYGGRNYCWYNNGWQGPGWYWCGYAYRPGFGWGGPVGWNGWRFDHDDFREHREFHEFHEHDHDHRDFHDRDDRRRY
jgi:hypothetical protein